MVSNWTCMIETDSSFHAVSRLRHTSWTVLDEKVWQISLSATHEQMFSVGDTSGDHADLGINRIPSVSRKIRTWHATCGLALSCWKMVFGRPLRQGTTTESKISEMHRSVFKLQSMRIKICVSCIQWLPNPSHQVQGPYANIECKQAASDFL